MEVCLIRFEVTNQKYMSTKNNTSKSVSVKIDQLTLQQLKEEFKEEAQTLVHCNYVSKRKYTNGGWVNIYPTTFLVHENEVIPMLYAVNIPIAPNIHVFKSAGELKQFTLIFPPIPKEWYSFSLIENCNDHEGFVVINIERNDSGVYEVNID
jgi:hypothetical protein